MILVILLIFNWTLSYICNSLNVDDEMISYRRRADFVELSDVGQIYSSPVIMHQSATTETYVLTDSGYFDESTQINVLSFKLPSRIFHSHALEFKLNIKVTPSSMIRTVYTTNVRNYLWYLQKHIASAKLSSLGKDWVILDLKREFFKQKNQHRHKYFFNRRRVFFLRMELTCESSNEAKLQEKSYLSIVMPKKFKKRSKRSSPQFCKANQKTCCLHTTKISLEKYFNVNRILHPYNGVYDIHYCQGKCMQKSTMNNRDAVVQATGHQDNRCCVATQFDSLNFVYVQNTSKYVMERTIEKFSAKRCGCV